MDWTFTPDVSVRVKPRLTVTSNDAAIEAALKGLGITRLLSYQVASYVSSGQLQTVLSEFEPKALPIHVIHREGLYASAKVRTFVDLIVAKLRAIQALNQHD
jgi:DNA-binding transcriptional LysR family regulator